MTKNPEIPDLVAYLRPPTPDDIAEHQAARDGIRTGDKVMGIGRHGAKWRRKPVGTVTGIRMLRHSDRYVGRVVVRVQWDKSAVEDDMSPADLIPVMWSEQLGRYVTCPVD
jgi:hypothetical protein